MLQQSLNSAYNQVLKNNNLISIYRDQCFDGPKNKNTVRNESLNTLNNSSFRFIKKDNEI